jgi:hypothetical protein
MPAPTTAPTKEPVKTPVTDPTVTPNPNRYVRRICPQQTRKWTAPWVIYP